MQLSLAGRRPRGGQRRTWGLRFGITVPVLVLLIGLVLPLVRILLHVADRDTWPKLTGFFASSVNRDTVFHTLELGALVGFFGVLVAFLLAYVQTQLDVPGKRILHVIALVPIVSPPFAVATAVIVLFGRNGMISAQWLGLEHDIYGLDGLTLVLVLSFFPVVYMNLVGMLQRMDPALSEAARNLGASQFRVFRTVTFPLVVPGLASGFLLLFVEAIADLANPLVLGGNYTVLSSRAYIAITGEYDLGTGAILSLMLIVPALSVFLLQRMVSNRKSVVTVTGKPSGSRELIANRWRWIPFATAVLICTLIVVIYGAVVLGSFTRILGVNNAFTLDHWRYILSGVGSEAVFDTVRLAAIATPLAGLLGMVLAWLIVRKLDRGRGVVDFLAMLGIGIPGTVLGIAYILTFRNQTKLFGLPLLPAVAGGSTVLAGQVAICLMFLIRSIPASVRSGVGALQQIHPSIEEASTSLGASNSRTFRQVTIPLIRPALISGLSFGFARSMTTLSPIVFLVTPDTKILTSQILGEVDGGRFGNAFAFCCVLILIVSGVLGLIRLLVGNGDLRRARRRSSVHSSIPSSVPSLQGPYVQS
jgi:iron(III) transport system permease protein